MGDPGVEVRGRACGEQMAISAFRDLEVFVEKEGKGGCRVLAPAPPGLVQPLHTC